MSRRRSRLTGPRGPATPPGDAPGATGPSGAPQGAGRTSAHVLLLLLSAWATLLGAAFVYVAVSSRDDLGPATLYGLGGFFLLLLGVRSGYELVRRLRGRG